MKLFIKTFLLLCLLVLVENSSFALTDNQIKKICRKNYRKVNCINKLKDKRSNLLQGNKIEIPTIPYKE